VPDISNAELMTVGFDEVVVTCSTEADTTISISLGDHEVTTTGQYHSARITGLEPATTYRLEVDGSVPPEEWLPAHVTTLARPAGRHLATVATANDVHFGETQCGLMGHPGEIGPVFRSEPGATPYPELMNRAAIAEIQTLDPDAIVVKGDLTNLGTQAEYAAFLDAYETLGPRMRHVRGNHDAMITQTIASDEAPYAIHLGGVTLAVIDTVVPGVDRGAISAQQLVWLDDLAAETTQPVLVFGHHHPWNPTSPNRSATYFGINPDDSDALIALIARREAIAGYFAGHTHRNRVRRFGVAREVPIGEVACVKDYPGAWAEYNIYESGYTQVVRRIADVRALAWTEKTRGMFDGLYRDYALGSLGDRCFTQSF
jgi:3',5'-cyclic-AMP phosphodiesterase